MIRTPWEGIRVGLLANPHAGCGEEAAAAAIATLLRKLTGVRLVALAGSLEARVAAEERVALEFVHHEKAADSARTAAAVLLDFGVGGLIGIGGDGTLCDIASVLCGRDSGTWLLGVGVGSSNVGPLVTVSGDAVAALSFDDLEPCAVHGIEVSVGDASLSVAFNDVAVSNTFFGTRNGCRMDLDAAARLVGLDRAAVPVSVCGRNTWVAKNGLRILDNAEGNVQQLIASPLNRPRAFAGLAVSGLMCWGPYVGQHAILAAASAVMIRTKLAPEDIAAVEPLRLSHISFGAFDRIDMGGFLDGAVVVVDGNPMRRLTGTDVLSLRLRPGVVRALHRGSEASAQPPENGDAGKELG